MGGEQQEQEAARVAAGVDSAEAASPADANAAPAGGSPNVGAEGDELPELPLFSCKEAYVYQVPPATTAGHRAEMWDVNKWLATVSLRVMQADDDAYIRMTDESTGELFAECPVPTDKPLVTAVEPVVDSSRYFVLRIVDRDSQRHAFIGIGFRERNEASDFSAALHEFLQYIKRKRTADAMRSAYEERLQSAGGADGGEQVAADGQPQADLSIKEGETLHLKITAARRAGSSGFVSAKRGQLGKQFSLIMDGRGGAVAALSPPPSRTSSDAGSQASSERSGSDAGSVPAPLDDMCVSPASAGSSSFFQRGDSAVPCEGLIAGTSLGAGALPRLSGGGDGEVQTRLRGLRLQQDGPPSSSTSLTSGSPAAPASASATDDDDFGDFEG